MLYITFYGQRGTTPGTTGTTPGTTGDNARDNGGQRPSHRNRWHTQTTPLPTPPGPLKLRLFGEIFKHDLKNYLKNIFHLQQLSPQGVSTNAIAEKLETKPSSATDMVQKLAEKEVLTYIKYKGTTLTENGRKIAANIIRKHRLWEVFLVEKLNFQWDEVHEIAEQLEHIHSEDLISRLDKFLEYPSVDPHGDPIPDSNGNFKKTEKLANGL